jgi:hypothetical protein
MAGDLHHSVTARRSEGAHLVIENERITRINMSGFKPALIHILGIVAAVLSAVIILWFVDANSQRPEGSSPVGNRSVTNTSVSNATDSRARLNLALVSAVKKQDAAQVKALLSRGADPNTRDNSAYKDWQKQMEELVTEQDPATGELKTHKRGEGARPYLGPTVLMIAAHQGDDATVQLLIDAGADLNAKGVDYGAASAAATDWNVDLEDRVTPFIEAMLSGEVTTMRLLLKKGANVNAQDSEGLTALDWAYNLVPTSEPTPQHQKFLDRIFQVLKQAGAKRSQDIKQK